jgi:hypothetical protein
MNHDPQTTSTQTKPAGGSRAAAIAVVVGPLLAIAIVWFALNRGGSEVTIGVEGRKVVEIAGPELQAAPFTPGDAVSVRIADVQPIAGGFRYDLRYVTYGPGQHDLAKTLSTPDGKPLPPRDDLSVDVDTLLPESHKGDLYETPNAKINLHSGYALAMRALWFLWLLLLVPLVWLGRKKKHRTAPVVPPPTVSERLRSLLEQASHEHLSSEQQADLEQLLIAFWSQRLKLSSKRLGTMIEQLRKHPEASRQWNRVEGWLHSGKSTTNGTVARELLHDLDTLTP